MKPVQHMMIHRKLTKSLVLAGLQCHKQLWLRVHEPGAAELVDGAGDRAAIERQRRLVETAAVQYPGGRRIEPNGDGLRSRIRATDELLARGARVLFGATFEFYGVLAIVDILARTADGWSVLAVRPSADIEPEDLPDLAVQTYVVRGAGLDVDRCELLHPEHEPIHSPGLPRLVREDLTAEVLDVLPAVAAEVKAQDNMLFGPLPQVPVGPHCSEPRECPFLERCRGSRNVRLRFGRLRQRTY